MKNGKLTKPQLAKIEKARGELSDVMVEIPDYGALDEPSQKVLRHLLNALSEFKSILNAQK